MIYLVIIVFFMLIIQFFMITKLKKNILELSGIPISLALPIKHDFYLKDRNLFLFLSLECNICTHLIEQIMNEDTELDNIILVFQEEMTDVQKYFEKLNLNFNKYKMIFQVDDNDTFLDIKPFLYIVNKSMIILDKNLINNVKDLHKI